MSQESWSRSSTSARINQDSASASSRKDSRYDDYDDTDRRRNDSRTIETSRNRSERDRYGKSSSSTYRSYDSDRNRDSRRYKDRKSSRRRSRSRSSRSSSYEKESRSSSSRYSKRRSSPGGKISGRSSATGSNQKSQERSSSSSKHVRIIRASRSRSKSKTKSPTRGPHSDRAYFEMMYNKSEKHNAPINSMDVDFDKEKIHKEMQERLIQHLAKEGKVYPPPKPQASHPVFANDGSFLETFKQLQQQQQYRSGINKTNNMAGGSQSNQQPMFGKRRGGKILKTGIVEKPRIVDESVGDVNQNDAWAMYMQEVKKYKNVSCDADTKTRPLVK